MKIKLLLISVRADFGGGPKHVDQLIKNLKNQCDLYVVSPCEEPYGVQWSQDKEISHFVGIPHRKFKLGRFIYLIKLVNKEKIEIVHSHGKGAGIYSRFLKIFCPSIKVVHTFHGIDANYGKILRYVYLKFEKCLSLLTNYFIYVSRGELSKAEKMGIYKPSKSQIIFNGIEDVKVGTKSTKSIFSVISISRFDYAKNMDYAYEIAHNFKGDNRVKFTWVGDGMDKERLEYKSLKEGLNIDFIGFTNDPIRYLHNSDVLLSTSRFEGLPYALIEACSAGIPIIASNVVGNNDIVKDLYNGILFDSVEGAVKAIGKLLNDNDLLVEMGKTARKDFEMKYSLDKMIHKLILLYESLVK